MLLELVALALTALILIPSGAHLFELPGKIDLDRDAYFTVQGIYAGWSWFAVPIFAAILANGAVFLVERRRDPPASRAALLSSALIVLSRQSGDCKLDRGAGQLGGAAPAMGIRPCRKCPHRLRSPPCHRPGADQLWPRTLT
jgi:hypothetical protein